MGRVVYVRLTGVIFDQRKEEKGIEIEGKEDTLFYLPSSPTHHLSFPFINLLTQESQLSHNHDHFGMAAEWLLEALGSVHNGP